MPKVPESASLPEYAPVADRIVLFRARYPDGRIHTQLVKRTREEVIFRAAVYCHRDDERPSATGWAAEREGDGEVNTVACLENTETSAIGRALANLGFTAARQRPSVEEMAKAARARFRVIASPRSEIVADLEALLERARDVGLRAARAARWRQRVHAGAWSAKELARLERWLRAWVRRQVDP